MREQQLKMWEALEHPFLLELINIEQFDEFKLWTNGFIFILSISLVERSMSLIRLNRIYQLVAMSILYAICFAIFVVCFFYIANRFHHYICLWHCQLWTRNQTQAYAIQFSNAVLHFQHMFVYALTLAPRRARVCCLLSCRPIGRNTKIHHRIDGSQFWKE